jgi:hypothetical protein
LCPEQQFLLFDVNKLPWYSLNKHTQHVHLTYPVASHQCRTGHIDRVKANEAAKAVARAGGAKVSLKRTPKLPKAAYTVKLAAPETIQPIPFSNVL